MRFSLTDSDTVNPDTSQVETVKVDELKFALRLLGALDAFHLTFTSGNHLFMLERVSVTTAQAHTCISSLGGRISMEWWMIVVAAQQQCGQQQSGQLFGVLMVVYMVAAVLVRAVGEGSEAGERSFCGLVRVGQQCSKRVILTSSSGPFLPSPPCFRTFGGCQLACAPRCARTRAREVAAWPLWRSRWIARPQTPRVASNGPRSRYLHVYVCIPYK